MALIVCSECGKEFSDKAPACPNCGCPTDCIVESAEDDNGQERVVEEILPNNILNINNLKIDLDAIIKIHGNNRFAATNLLVLKSKQALSYKEARVILDNYYDKIGNSANITFLNRLKNQLDINNIISETQIEYDVGKFVEVYGKDKITICKKVAKEYNLNLADAKQVVDRYFVTNTKEIKEIEKNVRELEKEKVLRYDKEGIPYCPKCHSTSITYTDKKLSLGRAIVGNALAGGVGAVLGGQSSKKGKCKCLKCGHTWKI